MNTRVSMDGLLHF